jgi:hypothetical protein
MILSTCAKYIYRVQVIIFNVFTGGVQVRISREGDLVLTYNCTFLSTLHIHVHVTYESLIRSHITILSAHARNGTNTHVYR